MLLAVDGMTIGIIVVAIIIGLLYVYAVAIRSYFQFVYDKYRRRKTDVEMTGGELARSILDNYGLVDVEVKKGLSNTYRRKSNKIILAFRVFSRNSISADAIVMQLCTLAAMNASGDKKAPKFESVASLGVLSALLIFASIITLIAYLAGAAGMGLVTLIVLIVAVVLYLIAFIISILNIKNQKYVNKKVEELMNSLSIFSEEDQKKIQRINNAYMQYRVIECLLTFFYALYFLFRILGLLLKGIGKK